jgi:hypothetical protein
VARLSPKDANQRRIADKVTVEPTEGRHRSLDWGLPGDPH